MGSSGQEIGLVLTTRGTVPVAVRDSRNDTGHAGKTILVGEEPIIGPAGFRAETETRLAVGRVSGRRAGCS